jgi:hypothetical protein
VNLTTSMADTYLVATRRQPQHRVCEMQGPHTHKRDRQQHTDGEAGWPSRANPNLPPAPDLAARRFCLVAFPAVSLRLPLAAQSSHDGRVGRARHRCWSRTDGATGIGLIGVTAFRRLQERR